MRGVSRNFWVREICAGDIAQLNAKWGTQSADFAEIKAVLKTLLSSQPASRAGWVSRRPFIRDADGTL